MGVGNEGQYSFEAILQKEVSKKFNSINPLFFFFKSLTKYFKMNKVTGILGINFVACYYFFNFLFCLSLHFNFFFHTFNMRIEK